MRTHLAVWILGWLFSLSAPVLARGADATLATAVQQKDAPSIQRLLTDRADVNATQADGMTALLWAAYYDDARLVDRLLAAGAAASAANRYGVTPLSLACARRK